MKWRLTAAAACCSWDMDLLCGPALMCSAEHPDHVSCKRACQDEVELVTAVTMRAPAAGGAPRPCSLDATLCWNRWPPSASTFMVPARIEGIDGLVGRCTCWGVNAGVGAFASVIASVKKTPTTVAMVDRLNMLAKALWTLCCLQKLLSRSTNALHAHKFTDSRSCRPSDYPTHHRLSLCSLRLFTKLLNHRIMYLIHVARHAKWFSSATSPVTSSSGRTTSLFQEAYRQLGTRDLRDMQAIVSLPLACCPAIDKAP